MVDRSDTDILYGLLGQYKRGVPSYKYETHQNQFSCTTIIESMKIEVTEFGSSKKTAREASARVALASVKEKLKNVSDVTEVSPTKYVIEETSDNDMNGAGVYLMHVNSWLNLQRRRPTYEIDCTEKGVVAKMRLYVPEFDIDETFEAKAKTPQIAKQICGQKAFQHLEALEHIPPLKGKHPIVISNETKKTTRKLAPLIPAKITEASLELLDQYLLAIGEYPEEVDQYTASMKNPLELLPAVRFEVISESVSSKLSCVGPCLNWNPWMAFEITEGLWHNMTRESTSNLLYRLEKRMKNKKALPILAQKSEIIETISKNQVTIIAGGTGSGKSTQVVQYLLEEFIDRGDGFDFAAYVTEPRKIAAISLAKRVATERKEKLGTSIGYCVRLDNTLPRPYGSVVFCTTGVLLKRLHGSLKGISHIIIDEVHERSLETDFLLILIKKLIQSGSLVKVVLMSASMNTSLFSEYFDNCPVIDVKGEVFPVETLFLDTILEKLELTATFPLQHLDEIDEKPIFHLPLPEAILVIEKIIERILKGTPKGSILVFMPGWFEITQTKELLEKNELILQKGTIFPLHSSVTKEEQNKVFLPSVKLKIILSTNIAESSLTIDDVSYVIDSCRHKEAQKHQNVIQLDTAWISKSSLIQRRGRAGRLKRGICFHLCTQDHYDILPDNSVPEILRLSLDDIILQIKALGIGEPAEVLQMAIDPPSDANLKDALNNLRLLGAINSQNELTKLGMILARFPVEANFGRAIVLGTILGVGPIVCELIAMISVGSPYSNSDAETSARDRYGSSRISDHITLVQILQNYLECKEEDASAAEQFALSLDLKVPVLALATRVKSQFMEILKSFGFPSELFNDNPIEDHESSREILDLLLAVLSTALYPNICYVKDKKKVVTIDGSLAIFLNKLEVDDSCLLVFTEKIVSRNSICRESSVISPIVMMLFSSRSISCVGFRHILLDERFHIDIDVNVACKIASLRPHIEKLINNTCDVCSTKNILTEEEFMLADLLIELCLT